MDSDPVTRSKSSSWCEHLRHIPWSIDGEGGASMGTDSRPTLMVYEGPTLSVYERPTLTVAGSFKKATGLGCSGPRDQLFQKQCV